MQITDLLRRVHDGDAEAMNAVAPLVYQELKQLAMGHLRYERAPAAIEATALVHEAFLRLAGSPLPEFENRSHFYGIAARVMRQVLVDLARARRAGKRGEDLQVTLSGFEDLGAPAGDAFLVLNDALDRLARDHPLKGQLIELRFFAGLTAEESAAALAIPVHNVRHQLRLGLAWLRRELAEERV
ncbi:MAG: ECF-type sigma factor [Bryobacteraceae bacterium]|jgi:RNA polymerase sigma factor (TIGR02999 family)